MATEDVAEERIYTMDVGRWS